jgi:membrane-associated phospholipid phosphatase
MLAFAMAWSHKHPVLGRFTRPLVDPRRRESGTLALFAILLVMAAWGLTTLLISLPLFDWPARLDQAVMEAAGQLRTPWADLMMAFFNGLGTAFVLLPASAGVLFWLLIRRRPLAAWHWAGAVAVGLLLASTVSVFVSMYRTAGDPGGDLIGLSQMHLTLSVVIYGFFAVLIARELPARRRVWPYMVAAVLVVCIALARLYFGDHRVSDLTAGTLLGLIWITIIGIAYRRRMRRSFWTAPLAGVFFLLVGVSASWYGASYSRTYIEIHSVPDTLTSISISDWWTSGWKPEDTAQFRDLEHRRPLNVQVVGDLDALKQELEADGWVQPRTATWATIIEMLQPTPTADTLPLLPASWQGRDEALVMHRPLDESDRQLVLRLWPTGVRMEDRRALWAGVVAEHKLSRVLYFFSYWSQQPPHPRDLQQLDRSIDNAEKQQPNENLLLMKAP